MLTHLLCLIVRWMGCVLPGPRDLKFHHLCNFYSLQMFTISLNLTISSKIYHLCFRRKISLVWRSSLCFIGARYGAQWTLFDKFSFDLDSLNICHIVLLFFGLLLVAHLLDQLINFFWESFKPFNIVIQNILVATLYNMTWLANIRSISVVSLDWSPSHQD